MSRTTCWIALAALAVLGFAAAPAGACIPGTCVPVSVSPTGACYVCVLHPPDNPMGTITCIQLSECRCVTTFCAQQGASTSASMDWKTAVLGSERAEPVSTALPL